MQCFYEGSIKRFCKQVGITLAELAEQTGKNPRTLERWDRGETSPTLRNVATLVKAAENYGVPGEFYGDNPPQDQTFPYDPSSKQKALDVLKRNHPDRFAPHSPQPIFHSKTFCT